MSTNPLLSPNPASNPFASAIAAQATSSPAGAEPTKGNGLGLAGFIVSVCGAAIGLGMAITFPVALAAGITGLVLASVGYAKARKDRARKYRKLSFAGIAVGALAITFGIVGAVMVGQAVNDVSNALDKYDASITAPGACTYDSYGIPDYLKDSSGNYC
jgi:hypothetical protein